MKSFTLGTYAGLSGLVLILLVGCSSEPGGSPSSSGPGAGGAGGTGAGAGSSVASSSASTGGAGGASPACDGEKVPGSGEVVVVSGVSATVVDTDGAPVPDQIAQLCGLDVCLGATTGADGKVFIAGDDKNIIQPAFKVGDGLAYAKMLRPLSAASTTFDPLVVPKFPSFAEGKPLVPGGSASSNGVTLTLAEGAAFEFDILLYDDPATQVFRAAAIPDSMMDPDVTQNGTTLFYALSPMGTLLCPSAKLTLPNTAGLPAGAAVEILALGLDVVETWAPYGAWHVVSEGHVSADGSTVSTDDGGGLPLLTVVGVRPK